MKIFGHCRRFAFAVRADDENHIGFRCKLPCFVLIERNGFCFYSTVGKLFCQFTGNCFTSSGMRSVKYCQLFTALFLNNRIDWLNAGSCCQQTLEIAIYPE